MTTEKPRSTTATTPDGLRPKSAFCPGCGYRFGGIPIRDGAIVCPECGRRFEFRFPRRARPRPIGRARAGAMAIAVAALMTLGVWASRESPEAALTIAAGGVLVIAGVVGLAQLRNRLLADPDAAPDEDR